MSEHFVIFGNASYERLVPCGFVDGLPVQERWLPVVMGNDGVRFPVDVPPTTLPYRARSLLGAKWNAGDAHCSY